MAWQPSPKSLNLTAQYCEEQEDAPTHKPTSRCTGNRMHHVLSNLSRNNLYISADGKGIWLAYDCNQPQYCLPNNY